MSFVSKLASLVAHIHWPYSRRVMTYERFIDLKKNLRNGDIIFTRTFGEFSNLFIGKLTHAGIYFNGYVYEAILTGIAKTDVGFFLSRKDEAEVWSLVTPLSTDEAILADSILDQIVKNKTEYDLEFSSKNKSYYCFELVAETLNTILQQKLVRPIETILGSKFMAESFIANDAFFKKL